MAFDIVSKKSFLKNVNAVLTAGNLPTLGDLAENARQIAQKKMGEADSLTNSALAASAAAQDKYQAAIDAAALVLAESQKTVKADLNAAAVLDDEARQLAAAADYFTK